MSAYEKTPDWQSPRKKAELEAEREKKVEDDIKQYGYKRFEDYMEMADIGMLTRALAISAFREELEYNLFVVDECPTEAIDTVALKKMLEDESE